MKSHRFVAVMEKGGFYVKMSSAGFGMISYFRHI